MTITRAKLLPLLAETHKDPAKVNAGLIAQGFDPLTPDELVTLGFTPDVCPDTPPEGMLAIGSLLGNVLANLPPLPADAPKGAEIDDDGLALVGAVLGKTKGGRSITAVTLTLNKMTGVLSEMLKEVDPAAYTAYKAMKAAKVGTHRERNVKAYVWMFARLMQLGYLPNEGK